METLQSKEQFDMIIKGQNIIMMFTADWCPDCRVIDPILPDIEKMFPEFKFMSVDRDDFIDICQQYDVFGIPSFIVFQNGRETDRFVSKNRKTKEEIEEFIKGARQV